MVSRNVTVLFVWTCSHCGTRQVFTKHNTIFQFGECFKCEKTTRIKAYRPDLQKKLEAIAC